MKKPAYIDFNMRNSHFYNETLGFKDLSPYIVGIYNFIKLNHIFFSVVYIDNCLNGKLLMNMLNNSEDIFVDSKLKNINPSTNDKFDFIQWCKFQDIMDEGLIEIK